MSSLPQVSSPPLPPGQRWIPVLTTGVIFSAFAASLWLLWRVLAGGPMVASTPWFSGPDFRIDATLHIDDLSAVLLSMVLGIASLVFLYATVYMRGEATRFWLFLTMFVAAMALLLVASSTLLLFTAWELVGFCSYLLIGFWRDEHKPARASQKAFIINRIGDALLLSGLILNGAGRNEDWVFALLFLGVCAKSAQLPLHGWLPDAMAGPTPVSSLIHAATMVAAGVYVFARLAPNMPPSVMVLAATIGSLSALYGAAMALIQTDLKRMLAFSTMSQLGLMMLGIASGDTSAGLMHLFAHAFFKCALFLLAGLLIHAAHSQELYQIGGFRAKAAPATANGLMVLFAVAAAALAGVPLTSGFLSKDAIVAASLDFGWEVSWLFPAAALLTTLLTGTYLSRAFRWIFVSPQTKQPDNQHTTFIPAQQWLPVVVLVAGSGWWMLSFSPTDAAYGWLGHLTGAKHASAHDLAMLLSLLAATAGLLAGWFGWKIRAAFRFHQWLEKQQVNWGKWLSLFAKADALLDEKPLTNASLHLAGAMAEAEHTAGSGHWLGRIGLAFARVLGWADKHLLDGLINLITNTITHSNPHLPSVAGTAARFDSGVVDGLVNGVAWSFGRAGQSARKLQSGKVQTYLVLAGLALLSAISFFLFRGLLA